MGVVFLTAASIDSYFKINLQAAYFILLLHKIEKLRVITIGIGFLFK